MARALNGLNKAQKERLCTYLLILEQSLTTPPTPLKISKRVKDRVCQKYRNYKHAIEIVRYILDPVGKEIDFKSNKKHEYRGEAIHVHLKSRKRGLRKISQCEQPTEAQSISA